VVPFLETLQSRTVITPALDADTRNGRATTQRLYQLMTSEAPMPNLSLPSFKWVSLNRKSRVRVELWHLAGW
jgi:hypothetical protein